MVLANGACMSEKDAADFNITLDDTITERIPGCSVVDIYLRPITGGELTALRQKSRTLLAGQWVADQTLEPQIKCELMVESWNIPGAKPSRSAFLAITNLNLQNAIDAAITRYMFPNLFEDEGFTKALSSSQPSSAPESQSE